MFKELNLGHSKLTLVQSNCQIMLQAEEKNFMEVVNLDMLANTLMILVISISLVLMGASIYELIKA